MSSISMKNLTLTVFGESHGECIGAVLTGFPAGHKIDYCAIKSEMDKRKPGNNELSTPRKEEDSYKFVSGVLDGVTTGAPICVLIPNTSQHSNDYEKLKEVPRPSHADYPAYIKYNGYNDIRGGGHFSGRLTAPIVCLGALCKQYLERLGIKLATSVSNIGGILNNNSDGLSDEIIKLISETSAKGDSVGGQVLCTVSGIRPGLGGPLFEGIEGKISSLMFGIPAVKAVEFGLGTEFSNSYGSVVNDGYCIVGDKVCTITNNNGGITGGITNGNHIVTKVTFKPTPSIFLKQQSVNLKDNEECKLSIKGRHDPCIVVRAVPVVESVMALGILDMVM